MDESDDAAWQDFRAWFDIGQLVDDMIVEHRPFGVFVDIGHPQFLGLVELRNMEPASESRPGHKAVMWPAIGTRIKAVLIAFGNHDGHQPRLRLRQDEDV